MDRSHLICAQCQWSWPLQSSLSYFEGEALESVACPQCNALALRVLVVKAKSKRFSNQIRIRDVAETPISESHAVRPREMSF